MSRFKVLLIDDEQELIETVGQRLLLRDIDATAVTDGAKALELLEKEHFDVVVVDVKMPKMSGIECLRRIKSIQPELNVILLTGHGSSEDCDSGMENGAFDYLIKPVNIEDLILKMEAAVGAKGVH